MDPSSVPSTSSSFAGPRCPVSDDQLLNLPIIELNKLLKRYGPEEAKRLKHRRKVLKNRGYEAASKTRQLQLKQDLLRQHTALSNEIQKTREENRKVEEEIREIKDNFETLKQWALQRNIPIPPHLDMDCS